MRLSVKRNEASVTTVTRKTVTNSIGRLPRGLDRRRVNGITAAELVAVMVSGLDDEVAVANEIEAGAKEQRALAGRPVHERSTVPLKPEAELAVTVALPELPAVTVRAPGSTAMVKSVTLNWAAVEVLGLKLASPE